MGAGNDPFDVEVRRVHERLEKFLRQVGGNIGEDVSGLGHDHTVFESFGVGRKKTLNNLENSDEFLSPFTTIRERLKTVAQLCNFA